MAWAASQFLSSLRPQSHHLGPDDKALAGQPHHIFLHLMPKMMHKMTTEMMPHTESPRKPSVVPVNGIQNGAHTPNPEPSTISKISRRLVLWLASAAGCTAPS